jgi:V/A-type H+-transporting ATPase subunit F
MYKIGIIGDKDSVLGFKAVGLSVFPVAQPSEAEKILRKLAGEQFAVIYITEQVARDITPVIGEYSDRMFPAIIPIPGNQGTLGIGMKGVKKSVERAVGADILFNE